MNRFSQHVPAYIELDGESFDFATTEELLANPIIQRYKHKGFSHFALNRNMLMAIYNEGFKWWAVGYIRNPASINLPQWNGGKYLVSIEGKPPEVFESKDVLSSCGGEVTLRDGRIGKEVR